MIKIRKANANLQHLTFPVFFILPDLPFIPNLIPCFPIWSCVPVSLLLEPFRDVLSTSFQPPISRSFDNSSCPITYLLQAVLSSQERELLPVAVPLLSLHLCTVPNPYPQCLLVSLLCSHIYLCGLEHIDGWCLYWLGVIDLQVSCTQFCQCISFLTCHVFYTKFQTSLSSKCHYYWIQPDGLLFFKAHDIYKV